jgi:hypothetical protein
MRVAPLAFLVAIIATAACTEERPADQTSTEAAAFDKVANTRPGRPGAITGAVGSMASRDAAPELAAPPAPPAFGSSAEAPEQLPVGTQSVAPSMVIRTGDARVEVDSLEVALAKLQDLAQRIGGFIGNTSMQSGERELRQATVELKMPAERFAAAQAGLSELGKVEYVNVNAQDVGEEFVDVTARADNARRLEQRLIVLLASRTGRLEEVLSVERELARIRETIERYEGRLRYLKTRAAVSTLMVNVHEKEPLVGQLGSSNRIVEAFRNAWRNFVGFVAFLIESLGVILPLGIIVAVIARWAWKRRPPRAEPPAPPLAG